MKPPTLLAALAGAGPALAYDIAFDKAKIPALTGPWPVLNLGGPVQPGPEVMRRALEHRAPPSANLSDFAAGAAELHFDGADLVAFRSAVNQKITVLPPVADLRPVPRIDTSGIQRFLRDRALFPPDATEVRVVEGDKLNSVTHAGSASAPQQADAGILIASTRAQRTVKVDAAAGHSFDVHGTGSKAVFGFGDGGKLQSLSYLWHPATKAPTTVAPRSADDAHAAIAAQLAPSAKVGPVTVDSVEACFYDGGGRFIQPTLYFTATIGTPPGASTGGAVTHARVSGYVPLGQTALEPLPDLTNRGDQSPPAEPPAAPRPSRIMRRGAMPPEGFPPRPPTLPRPPRPPPPATPTVTVGRYVVRNDSAAWVASANDFWKQLSTTPSAAKYVDSQYFWAHPWEFTTQKEQYVDSVNVALTEVHGNWGYFTTYQNWGDGVHLSDIPDPGYGAGGNPNGHLAYWILHSCEVIPSATDYPGHTQDSFAPWWKVFAGGLHAAIGYRTEMWIADGVTGPFAALVAKGGAVIDSWLQTVHADSDYAARDSNWYYDDNRAMKEPMGRASTVFVCGHGKDRIWDTQKLGAPTCLQEVWWDN